MSTPPDETLPVRFARAVLMMLPPNTGWTKEDHAEWKRLTGTPIATVEQLKIMARLVIAEGTKVP